MAVGVNSDLAKQAKWVKKHLLKKKEQLEAKKKRLRAVLDEYHKYTAKMSEADE